MDDNVWEYPFGELEDDDDMLFHKPENRILGIAKQEPAPSHGGPY
jgi:hypothetical protein